MVLQCVWYLISQCFHMLPVVQLSSVCFVFAASLLQAPPVLFIYAVVYYLLHCTQLVIWASAYVKCAHSLTPIFILKLVILRLTSCSTHKLFVFASRVSVSLSKDTMCVLIYPVCILRHVFLWFPTDAVYQRFYYWQPFLSIFQFNLNEVFPLKWRSLSINDSGWFVFTLPWISTMFLHILFFLHWNLL